MQRTAWEQLVHALELRFDIGLERKALSAELGTGPHGVKSLLQRSYAKSS